MAVAFDEDNTSPRGSLRDGKRIVTRTGVTDWADVDLFAAELMPPSVAPNKPAVGAALPGNPLMRVDSFSVDPFGDAKITDLSASGLNVYDKAKWTITYERPPYAFDDEEALADGDPIPFLSHSWEGGGEFLTLPTQGLIWIVSAGSPQNPNDTSSVGDDANAGLFIPSIEHQVTWHRVPKPPFSDIRDRIGKVNLKIVEFATGACAPETLLFLNPSMRREIMSDGARAWEVNYKFSERRVIAEDQTAPGGWNHFYRNETGVAGFYRMKRTVPRTFFNQHGISDIYNRIDFAELFPV